MTAPNRILIPRFTPDPNAPVLTPEEREAVRRRFAEDSQREIMEDIIVDDVRAELMMRYLDRGYRGPLPSLY